jgi:hypothetical protein
MAKIRTAEEIIIKYISGYHKESDFTSIPARELIQAIIQVQKETVEATLNSIEMEVLGYDNYQIEKSSIRNCKTELFKQIKGE